MGNVDVGTAVGRDPQPLATLSGVCFVLDPAVVEYSILGVAAGIAPGNFRCLESLIPCSLSMNLSRGREHGQYKKQENRPGGKHE